MDNMTDGAYFQLKKMHNQIAQYDTDRKELKAEYLDILKEAAKTNGTYENPSRWANKPYLAIETMIEQLPVTGGDTPTLMEALFMLVAQDASAEEIKAKAKAMFDEVLESAADRCAVTEMDYRTRL